MLVNRKNIHAVFGLRGSHRGFPFMRTRLTCLILSSQLRDAGVIAMDQDEFSVQPTPHGVLFSRFMVRFESMKALMSVSESYGTR